jgi:hypothetical protein
MRARRDPFGTLIMVVGLATALALVTGAILPGLRFFLEPASDPASAERSTTDTAAPVPGG